MYPEAGNYKGEVKIITSNSDFSVESKKEDKATNGDSTDNYSISGSFAIGEKSSVATVEIPEDAGNSHIHVILEVRDNNSIVSMYDYRRVVINIQKPSNEK